MSIITGIEQISVLVKEYLSWWYFPFIFSSLRFYFLTKKYVKGGSIVQSNLWQTNVSTNIPEHEISMSHVPRFLLQEAKIDVSQQRQSILWARLGQLHLKLWCKVIHHWDKQRSLTEANKDPSLWNLTLELIYLFVCLQIKPVLRLIFTVRDLCLSHWGFLVCLMRDNLMPKLYAWIGLYYPLKI